MKPTGNDTEDALDEFFGERSTPPAEEANQSDEQAATTSLRIDGVAINPVTGEVVDTNDVDSLIEHYQIAKDANDRTYEFLKSLRLAIAAKTEGETKTRRLRGARFACKVEMPSDTWNNSKLKEAFNAYPQFRDKYLALETIKPVLREVKKLAGTTIDGDPALETFRNIVLSANNGPTGVPTVVIEKV